MTPEEVERDLRTLRIAQNVGSDAWHSFSRISDHCAAQSRQLAAQAAELEQARAVVGLAMEHIDDVEKRLEKSQAERDVYRERYVAAVNRAAALRPAGEG